MINQGSVPAYNGSAWMVVEQMSGRPVQMSENFMFTY
jgi:hypothetical protein